MSDNIIGKFGKEEFKIEWLSYTIHRPIDEKTLKPKAKPCFFGCIKFLESPPATVFDIFTEETKHQFLGCYLVDVVENEVVAHRDELCTLPVETVYYFKTTMITQDGKNIFSEVPILFDYEEEEDESN